MNKELIKKYIQENPNSYGRYIFKHFPNLLDNIQNFEGRTEPEKIYNFLHDSKIKICKCGNQTKWYGQTRGYANFCSIRCQTKDKRNNYTLEYSKRLIDLGYVVHSDLDKIRDNKEKIEVTNTKCNHRYKSQLINILNQSSICAVCGPVHRAEKLRSRNLIGLAVESREKRRLTFNQKRLKKLQKVLIDNLSFQESLLTDKSRLIDFLEQLKIDRRSALKKYLQQRYPEIYQRIDLHYGERFGQKLYNLLNEIDDESSVPVCLECGSISKFQKYSNRYNKFCSVGCKNKSKIPVIQSLETQKIKYGGWHLSTLESEAKKRSTCLQKYGVEHPFKNLQFIRKIWKAQYKIKYVKFASGQEVQLQGYEPQVLTWMMKNGRAEIDFEFELIPTFTYQFDGKQKTYHPDLFLPSENLIIEVKSKWTLQNSLEMTIEKLKSVKNSGYNVQLIVWDDKLDRPLSTEEIGFAIDI